MDGWQKSIVNANFTIHEVIKNLDRSGLQIALVVDENNKLLGTVTDGDIRRGLLKHINLSEPVDEIMNHHPIVALQNDSKEKKRLLMEKNRLHQLPIIDSEGFLKELLLIDSLFKPAQCDNSVVLMAGGLGERLRPLTDNFPKPLIKVGNKPVLELVLENFISQGFHNFYIAINYKGHLIQEYFGDGSQWNVNIKYLCEEIRLGTAGALSLLPITPELPFFVMNADLITKVNFLQLLEFHQDHSADVTMCVREYRHVIPYGVVDIQKESYQMLEINEKPEHCFFVNAGIYILNPSTLVHMPANVFFDMPDLLTKLINNKFRVSTYPIREYWLDIGRFEDLERAHQDFKEVLT